VSTTNRSSRSSTTMANHALLIQILAAVLERLPRIAVHGANLEE